MCKYISVDFCEITSFYVFLLFITTLVLLTPLPSGNDHADVIPVQQNAFQRPRRFLPGVLVSIEFDGVFEDASTYTSKLFSTPVNSCVRSSLLSRLFRSRTCPPTPTGEESTDSTASFASSAAPSLCCLFSSTASNSRAKAFSIIYTFLYYS